MLYKFLRQALGGLRNRENLTVLSTVVVAVAASASAGIAGIEAARKNDRSQLLKQTKQLASKQKRDAVKLKRL